MPKRYSERAPFNDWWYWSECLAKRLRVISGVYKENGEHEHGTQADEWARRLKDSSLPPVMAARVGVRSKEDKNNLQRLEEDAIYTMAEIFRELLVNLPFMSVRVQEILGVHWESCTWENYEAEEKTQGRRRRTAADPRIVELFWGPKDQQDEGIRSGKVSDGGLPGIINNLLAAEKKPSTRAPTEYGQSMLASATQGNLAAYATREDRNGFAVKPGNG